MLEPKQRLASPETPENKEAEFTLKDLMHLMKASASLAELNEALKEIVA